MSGIDWDKLPEVLAEHGVSYGDWKECSCGYPNPGPKHLARAVRAWVEGQMTEEKRYSGWPGKLFRRLVTPWAPVEGDKP